MTDITDVARHFGLPLSTLRFWERQGLVTAHRRAGRRCYDDEQLYRIALIRTWRQRDAMSIADIRAMLSPAASRLARADTIDGRIEGLTGQIDQLETARGYLRHLRNCSHPGRPETCPGFRAMITLPGRPGDH